MAHLGRRRRCCLIGARFSRLLWIALLLGFVRCGLDSGPVAGATGGAPGAGAAGQSGQGGTGGKGAGAGAAGSAGHGGSDAAGGRAGGGGTASLHWFTTCGDPVCRSEAPFDDPSTRNCTSAEAVGVACDSLDERCDGVAGCGATLICAEHDPKGQPGGCPISRARFKQAVAYLDQRELQAVHDQVVRMPLAAYEYRDAPAAGRQLGFIIDDVEPSPAVRGDHVNLYAYLSMAVAAIQVQSREIAALRREVTALRARSRGTAHAQRPVAATSPSQSKCESTRPPAEPRVAWRSSDAQSHGCAGVAAN